MPDERVERLARQLYEEGYVATKAEAGTAAQDVIAVAAAVAEALPSSPEETTPA